MIEIIKLALASLSINRLRSVLTMFGVIWGIATVIILVSVINGFRVENEKMFEYMGADLLVLEYSPFYEANGVRYPLSFDEDDASFIEANSMLIESAAPQIQEWREMQVEDKKRWFGLSATTEKMDDIQRLELASGRFITTVDNENASKVIVIGERVREFFFGNDTDVIGKKITMSGSTFTIIGVLQEQNTHNDWRTYIPLKTYESAISPMAERRSWGSALIYAKLKDLKRYDQAREEVRRILAARHGFEPTDEEAIRFRDFSEYRSQVNLLLLIMFTITYAIGLITLALGAVGVMNIMLVNVKERIREIGLRKAIGASRPSIGMQFLAEALILMLIGGVIGIILGVFVVGVLRELPLPEGFPVPAISAGIIYTAFAVNILVGIIAGTYPALQAASLDPIVALRTE